MIFSQGQDVRVRQGLAGQRLVGKQLTRVLGPLSGAGEKFALRVRATVELWLDHEPTKITDVRITSITSDALAISWKTSHLVRRGKINYGTSTTYDKEV